jgi:hypothetical protein
LLTSTIMATLGPYSFFAFETVVAVTFAGFVAHRVRRRPPLPADEQEVFVAVPSETSVATGLDPRTGEDTGAPAVAAMPLGDPGCPTRVAGA